MAKKEIKKEIKKPEVKKQEVPPCVNGDAG